MELTADDKINELNAPHERLGHQLRQIRVAHELKQVDVEFLTREIAEREDNPDFVVSNSRLSAIEHGHVRPGTGKLLALGEIYNLTREDLMKLWSTIKPRWAR